MIVKMTDKTYLGSDIKVNSSHLLHSYPVFHSIEYKWLDFLKKSTEIPETPVSNRYEY